MTTLVAALSGRALAIAARRSGERTIVFDRFADRDTRRSADEAVAVPAGGHGFDGDALCAAVAARRERAHGLVYGAGFEGDVPLLARLAALVPLVGNPPEVVAAAKSPLGFAALCGRLGIPHPETRMEPGDGEWLKKRAGASGGAHVASAQRAVPPRPPGALRRAPPPPRGEREFNAARILPLPSGERVRVRGQAPQSNDPEHYFQKRVAGTPVSALFLADGRRAVVLGCSEQWADGAAEAPYRYGGCAGPLALAPALERRVAAACDALAAALRLVGLNSLDLMVEGGDFVVLEVNPRPGATLDIFDGPLLPLWRLHGAAVKGRLPPPADVAVALGTCRAALILYAPRRLVIPDGLRWPRWSADRGAARTVVAAGAPVCTIRGDGRDPAAARAAARARSRAMLERLGAATTTSDGERRVG